jgi:hypothetical protein
MATAIRNVRSNDPRRSPGERNPRFQGPNARNPVSRWFQRI